MATNLFSYNLPEPNYFTKKQMDEYYNKIKTTNPSVSLEDSVKLSMDMLQNFHNLMCQIIFYYPETKLGIETINKEGHVFKIRIPEGSPARNKGITAISLSVNAFNNDNIIQRHRNHDYVISCVMNDINNKIVVNPEIGYRPIKLVTDKDLKNNIKLIFEEIDKIVVQTPVSTKKELISYMVENALTLEPYTNHL